MITPRESAEGKILAAYLRARGYTFSHIANELMHALTPQQRARLKAEGVEAGIPDYFILLKNRRVLWVELKRTVGGRVSPEQQLWLDKLNMCGQTAVRADGAAQAIKILEGMENG